MGVIGIIGIGYNPIYNQAIGTLPGSVTGGTSTGIVDIFNPNLGSGTFVTIPQEETGEGIGTETGTGTGIGTGTGTQAVPLTEREQVIERVRTHSDLDPNAKIKILNLAKNRPTLTAQDLRITLATCLYPTAQGLPNPEGYEYFLRQLEKGETVAGALANARTYYEADKAQSSPSDPNAPDSQDDLIRNGKLVIYALLTLGVLILINR